MTSALCRTCDAQITIQSTEDIDDRSWISGSLRYSASVLISAIVSELKVAIMFHNMGELNSQDVVAQSYS